MTKLTVLDLGRLDTEKFLEGLVAIEVTNIEEEKLVLEHLEELGAPTWVSGHMPTGFSPIRDYDYDVAYIHVMHPDVFPPLGANKLGCFMAEQRGILSEDYEKSGFDLEYVSLLVTH